MIKIQPQDKKFYVATPDKDFSPEHNKFVIEQTIKKHEAKVAAARKERDEGIGERSHMIASYFKSRTVESGKPIDQYLGKQWMTKLNGERILNDIRMLSRPSLTIEKIAKIARTNPTVRAKYAPTQSQWK
jgi:hypothetical protein